MKNLKLALSVFSISGLILGAAAVPAAFADYGQQPTSQLQSFACPPVANPVGMVCYTGSFYGQTLGDRPIEANVAAQVLAGAYDQNNGNLHTTVRLSLTKLTDPTDFYHDDGNLAVQTRAKICDYHRTCYWRQDASNSFVITRTYGQRYFENAPSFDVDIVGNGGAEDAEYVTELDIWLPMQQYPIVVKF